MKPPLLAIATVHHVGLLDPAAKRRDSYEGSGLSVSIHPSAWRAIARGAVGGDCWRLERADALFLDAHRLGRAARRRILAWAVQRGLATPEPAWRWSRQDDELDDVVHSEFASIEEAREERAFAEDGTIRRVASHRSTPALDALALQTRPTLSSRGVLDLVLPVWAHEVHGIDAVWWSDRYSPSTLSAPRGVIRAEAIASWTATRLDRDPPECDEEDEW